MLKGSFINTMWGDAGTTLAAVQMAFIRVFFIYPLKAVAPLAYIYWTRPVSCASAASHGDQNNRGHIVLGSLRLLALMASCS
eukprot:6346878-Amphidinium_carterae.1